ncbi:MAG: hypothetical protein KA712_05740 [Myxococcales bacterium]|nr:hypothetical protein [Myxococcales bacterium]
MQLHLKKRVEIVVEAPRAPKLLEMIDEAGAKGYTVIRDVSGRGNRGVRGDGHVSDVFQNVLIIVIAAEPIALRILERSQVLLESYAGIVTISDVEVIRDEHF